MTAEPTPRTSIPMDANLCRQHIGIPALMTVGAHNLRAFTDAFTFDAMLHPILKSGRRGDKARRMRVEITMDPTDTYNLKVYYWDNRRAALVTHYEASMVYSDTLSQIMFMLDNGQIPTGRDN